ncbi:MAG: hypothetical protein KJ556_06755, partial [Gammaproteobacteria bacterium]|nr:hypothetical protein [Gammaproteobacteria bacterium]MBU2245415.1 hypothetical protein [Gammaproteobacteria bacterium]
FNAALLSVRQASILLSASFRFHLTMNTLAVQLTLPLAGCAEDLHLQVTSLTTTVNLVALTRNAPCLAHTRKKEHKAPFQSVCENGLFR